MALPQGRHGPPSACRLRALRPISSVTSSHGLPTGVDALGLRPGCVTGVEVVWPSARHSVTPEVRLRQ
eukprot:247745-Pyramimonas_sp.AAC.1